MIKVLFVGMTYNPGGLETYMMNIFSKLQGKGFQFYFVNIYDKPLAYSKFIKNHGGVIYDISSKSNMYHRYYAFKCFFNEHNYYDIVHINALSINEIYCAKAAKRCGINNIIFQSHESNASHITGLKPFLKRMLAYYNRYLVNKDDDILKLAASNGCGRWMFGKNSKFDVINNGINVKYFHPNYKERIYWKNKLHVNNNKIIITTARLQKQKNYFKIIRVFKCVHNINPLVKLVIIGSGVEISHIKNLVKKLKLTNDVLFLGIQNKQHIVELLNIGDLMLMPSFYEAVPFSLTEAQSVGVPALVSLNRVPQEANITGNLIYISLAKSDEFWAKQAIRILKLPFNYENRLKMNYKVKRSNFNVDKSVNKIKNIYLRMASLE